MKFVISSSTLSAHLQTIGRVIVQKNTLPILDCFRFSIRGTTMTITASDNDSTLTTKLELVECDADIDFAVNAKTLQDVIKEIPEQPLDFYLNTETYEITIEYQNGQYRIMGQSAEEYPLPAADDEQRINLTIEAPQLLTCVNRAIVAAANDVLRPLLSAVCFDIQSDSMSVVASNGNHLALTKVKLDDGQKEGIFLLGTRPATLLRGILGKNPGDAVLSFGQRNATFSTEEYTLTCRLVEGRYPNYRSVIPQDNPNAATLNRLAFISVLRRVLAVANPATTLVKLRLDGSTLNITTEDMDYNKSAEENMLCEYTGSPLRIAFKGATLLELIQNIECEDITIRLADPSRAGVIVPTEQKEGEEVLMLIMPSVFND